VHDWKITNRKYQGKVYSGYIFWTGFLLKAGQGDVQRKDLGNLIKYQECGIFTKSTQQNSCKNVQKGTRTEPKIELTLKRELRGNGFKFGKRKVFFKGKVRE
jgi:hypothetical protein